MKIGDQVTVGETSVTVAGYLRLAVGPNESSFIVWDENMTVAAAIRGKGPDTYFVGMVGPVAPYENMAGERMFDTPQAMKARKEYKVQDHRGNFDLDGKTVWWLGDVTVLERRPADAPKLWSPGATKNKLTLVVGEMPGGTPDGDTHYLAALGWDAQGGYRHFGWWGRMLPPDTVTAGI